MEPLFTIPGQQLVRVITMQTISISFTIFRYGHVILYIGIWILKTQRLLLYVEIIHRFLCVRLSKDVIEHCVILV